MSEKSKISISPVEIAKVQNALSHMEKSGGIILVRFQNCTNGEKTIEFLVDEKIPSLAKILVEKIALNMHFGQLVQEVEKSEMPNDQNLQKFQKNVIFKQKGILTSQRHSRLSLGCSNWRRK